MTYNSERWEWFACPDRAQGRQNKEIDADAYEQERLRHQELRTRQP